MKTLMALLVVAALAYSPAAAAVDGLDVLTDFCPQGTEGCTALLELQNNYTGFGDHKPGTGNFVPGSELNQLFVRKAQDALAIGITGNLETNGNAWVIFLDTKDGGENTLDSNAGPGALTGMEGNSFDEGFEADYAIVINTAGNVYVDVVDLQSDSSRYLGYVPLDAPGVLAGDGADNPNGSSIGFDNTNNAGVIGAPPPDKTAQQHMADAATALTGVEMLLSLQDIGTTSESLQEAKIMVILTGSSGYLSNQTLPGLGTGSQQWNLGDAEVDFGNEETFPGDQFATVSLTSTATVEPPDGRDIPIQAGTGALAATQNNYTGFGDQSGSGTAETEGSELDALLMSSTAEALHIGITGNLENNGNYILIFLESGPGGVSELNVPEEVGPVSGVLQGLNGTVFEAGLEPTHVVMIDSSNEEDPPESGNWVRFAYLNIFDLRTNENVYLGRVRVGAGEMALEGGDNPYGAQMALDNSNAEGVSNDPATTPEENQTAALTATSGLELVLPFNVIGLSQLEIGYFVALSGNKGYLSNQFLPGLGGERGNLGDNPVNFNFVPGMQSGTFIIEEVSFTPVDNVAALKEMPDGSAVSISSTVSAVFPEQDEFYLQDYLPNNIAGILVVGQSAGKVQGDLATVEGYLSRVNGERAIIAAEVGGIGITSAAPSDIQPLVTSNKNVGGPQMGPNPGVQVVGGVNNVGLLMRSAGEVTFASVDEQNRAFTYINDGSDLFDGNIYSAIGLRVDIPFSVGFPAIGTFLDVTGVSSIVQIEGINQPRLRVRDSDDVIVVQ